MLQIIIRSRVFKKFLLLGRVNQYNHFLLKVVGVKCRGHCPSCGTVARERDEDRKGPGSRSRFDPGLQFSFFLIETLPITGQKSSKCLKNGSDRLRKGQLHRRHTAGG